jgi:hypothetical protein
MILVEGSKIVVVGQTVLIVIHIKLPCHFLHLDRLQVLHPHIARQLFLLLQLLLLQMFLIRHIVELDRSISTSFSIR